MRTHLHPVVALIAAVALAVTALAACSMRQRAEQAPPQQAVPPPADPDFPGEYRSWTEAVAPVRDVEGNELRRFYRILAFEPDADGRYPPGTVLVKVHHDLNDESVVTRIDVRRRSPQGTFDGWHYESFDPATRRKLKVDAETCHLCHATAPADGTFSEF